MKKIYIAYRFKGADLKLLKKNLEELSRIVEDVSDYKTFIFRRDEQKWGKIKIPGKKIAERAIKQLKKCNAILVEASEKSNGAYFETGYAKALKKKVIVVHKKGTETVFLDGIADLSIEYTDFQDLSRKLKGKV